MRDAEFRERIADEVGRILGDPAKTKQALIRYESIWYSGDARTSTPEKIAAELVGEYTGAARARRFRHRNAAEKSCGFAIGTVNEQMIQSTAHDFVEEHGVPNEFKKLVEEDGTITPAGWEQINKDVSKIERNALDWLKKTFKSARDDGHSGDELVGSVWYDPANKRQMELIELAAPSPGHSERIDFKDSSYGGMGDDVAYKGVSDFTYQLVDGCIVFFDVDEDF